MRDTEKPLVIYHGHCRDGWCAAWAATKFLKDPELHAGIFGQPPPDVAGRDVYVLDFSYDRETMIGMGREARKLVICDHHVTAQAHLEGLEEEFDDDDITVLFDLERSGAGIAWDYFERCDPNRGHFRPWLVNYVEDHDLWRHKLNDSELVNAFISTLPFTVDAWNAANSVSVQDAANKGKIVASKTAQYITEVLAAGVRSVLFEGLVARIVNAPRPDVSELLVAMLDNRYSVAIAWRQRKDGLFEYSLRSDGTVDVEELARLYGGGGHPEAAGFQTKELLDLEIVDSTSRATVVLELVGHFTPDERRTLRSLLEDPAACSRLCDFLEGG